MHSNASFYILDIFIVSQKSFPFTKNGVAALRQEAFCADRHFSNVSSRQT